MKPLEKNLEWGILLNHESPFQEKYYPKRFLWVLLILVGKYTFKLFVNVYLTPSWINKVLWAWDINLSNPSKPGTKGRFSLGLAVIMKRWWQGKELFLLILSGFGVMVNSDHNTISYWFSILDILGFEYTLIILGSWVLMLLWEGSDFLTLKKKKSHF